jgi:beta-phosphoglucomutase-like phosphatase (HAD superfamily)
MALATVGEPSYETAALKRLGLFDHFDAMCDCNSLGTTKREAFVYETAARLLLGSESGGEPAGESGPAESNAAVLVIEDVLHALQAAKQAGFTTVAVEDDASVKDKPAILETADYYLSN